MCIDPSFLNDFESLGVDCEFGIFQRHAGVEPLGLLRFSTVPLEGLLKGLDDDFVLIEQADLLTLETNSFQEYMVRIKPYGLYYHTNKSAASIDPREVKNDELARLKFLRQKFLTDLTDPERIFVRKMPQYDGEREIEKLIEKIRVRGPAWLVLVREASDPKAPRTVRIVGDRVLAVEVTAYAEDADPYGEQFTDWWIICQNIFSIATGRQFENSTTKNSALSIEKRLPTGGGSLSSSVAARTLLTQAVGPRLEVCAAPETGVFEKVIFKEPVPGRVNTLLAASVWIYVPKTSTITAGELRLSSAKIIRHRKLNSGLRDRWQRIDVSGRLERDDSEANVILALQGLFSDHFWLHSCSIVQDEIDTGSMSPVPAIERALLTPEMVTPDAPGGALAVHEFEQIRGEIQTTWSGTSVSAPLFREIYRHSIRSFDDTPTFVGYFSVPVDDYAGNIVFACDALLSGLPNQPVKELGIVIDGLPSRRIETYDFARSSQWQTLFVSVTIPAATDLVRCVLYVRGGFTGNLYTCGWRAEFDAAPVSSAYVSGVEG